MLANKNLNSALILAMALALLAGCAAKKPPAAADTESNTTHLTQDPTTPAGIVALSQHLKANQRVVYSSATGKYGYFVGGELNAEYDPLSRLLNVTSLAGNEAIVCKYSPDGALFVDPQGAADAATQVSRCNNLVLRLRQHLNR